MKVILLYLRIIKRHDYSHPVVKNYEESSLRFLETYKKFDAGFPHTLTVVNCGLGLDEDHDSLFDEIADNYVCYDGGGFDCGTYQDLGWQQECDLVVGLNTHTYFHRKDWLKPLAEAAQQCGPGVYGVTASFERYPHLRTPCIAFHPSVIRRYPYRVGDRQGAELFEAGPENFSLWAISQSYPCCLVTSEGEMLCKRDWRNARNIFRRGDQTNCLVWDRHTEVYEKSSKGYKAVLSKMADGI